MTFNDEALKQELLDKWQSLQAIPEFSGTLAGPFFGHAPKTFADAPTRILYIGKATKGAFVEANASDDAFGCNYAGFWSFARRLGGNTSNFPDSLSNVAWSNLCRIGTIKGNPSAELAERQRSLSVRILKAEIVFLKPSLIVCVAENSPYDDFLYDSLDTRRGEDGFLEKSEGNLSIYVRERTPIHPPVLWMRHPERKNKNYLNFAETEAMVLLGLVQSA